MNKIENKKFEPVIGLEVHIQLNTKTKMFCSCSTNIWKKRPNSLVCPTCLGLPGAMPVPNKNAIKKCQIFGLALGCKLSKESNFDRKHYFYPDLPKGYQITQYERPFCFNGSITAELGGKKRLINIRRVHLEEDTGKSIHGKKGTLLDFNKSGLPLLELVTEPDFKNPSEIEDFGKLIRDIARYNNISDVNMEKGNMRLEASVSMRKIGIKKLPPYRVEIKNINSFKFAKDALEYEIIRQTKDLESGKRMVNQTRGYNNKKKATFVMRVKEEEKDYRYFPEPDIPPLTFSKEYLLDIEKEANDLEVQPCKNISVKYSISEDIAKILVKNQEKLEYFESLVLLGHPPKESAKLLVNSKDIPKKSPKEYLKALKDKESVIIVKESDLKIIISQVIKTNEKAVKDAATGKPEAIMYLVGRVMVATKGQANPLLTRKIIKKHIFSKA